MSHLRVICEGIFAPDSHLMSVDTKVNTQACIQLCSICFYHESISCLIYVDDFMFYSQCLLLYLRVTYPDCWWCICLYHTKQTECHLLLLCHVGYHFTDFTIMYVVYERLMVVLGGLVALLLLLCVSIAVFLVSCDKLGFVSFTCRKLKNSLI